MQLFGDMEQQPGDNVPSFAFYGVRYDPFMKIPTTVERVPPKRVPTLGSIVPSITSKPVPEPAPEPEDDHDADIEEIEVDFPDPDSGPKGREGVNYTDNQYGVLGDNEFEVPDSLLAEVRESTLERELPLRDVLFESASMLFAHDEASNFVEAALRDGLGMEIELDESVQDAFVPLSRLSVLTVMISQTKSLPDSVKKTLLARLTIKTADDMILALNKKRVPDAIAALHKHYAAAVTKSGLEPDQESAPQNTVGVRASRK